MPSPDLVKQRHIVATLLQRARHALTIPRGDLWRRPRETMVEIDGYIAKGELELALNRLEDVTQQVSCRDEFWRDMERAARALKLDERASYYEGRLLGARPGKPATSD